MKKKDQNNKKQTNSITKDRSFTNEEKKHWNIRTCFDEPIEIATEENENWY